MGEVQYFRGDDATLLNERGQNDECVKLLEELLEKAKAGEIVGLSGAVQFADGSTVNRSGGFLYSQRIVGALMAAVVRLC